MASSKPVVLMTGHENYDAISPGPSTLRSGICRGGPFSGQMMHHGEPTRYIFKERGQLICRAMPAGGPSELDPDTQVGAYEYDGDQWQWTREIEWPNS